MHKIKQYIYDNCPLNEYGNKAPTIIEAGAAEGKDTLDFSNAFPHGRIYAFEPAPLLYEQAFNLVKDKKNVILSKKALAEITDEKDMVIADRFGVPWGSNSLLKPKIHLQNNPQITFNSSTKVETIKLDDVIAKHKITDIHLMWLDMQGYEPIVLKTSPISLKISRFIYSEINLVENYENNMLYDDFKKFMLENGFKVLDEEFLTNPTGIYDGGNVLFEKIK